MESKLITIMTPTYNRANLLIRLYESLNRQKYTDKFEWLIVDDGSSDNTKETIDNIKKETKLNVRYIYQKNAGKYKAVNTGINTSKGELFFCVDSDDYLADDAIENIFNTYKKIQGDNVAGILALKSDLNNNILANKIPRNIEYINTYLIEKMCRGEWSLIYKTSILKQYLFPDVGNEKFVTECVVYDRIAQKYKMYVLNKILTICEYQDDGLTQNIFKTMINNPTGYKIYHMQRIDMADKLKLRIKHIMSYHAFRKMSDNKKYQYEGKHKLLVNLLCFTGLLGKVYYKRRL